MPLPFDLEKAKAGHPLVTRDGKPVKFVAHISDAALPHQLIALVGVLPFHYFDTGKAFPSGESGLDLFLADPPKVKRSGVIRLYRVNNFEEVGVFTPVGVWATNPCVDSESAKAYAAECSKEESDFLKEITVEWEEPA